MTAVPLTLVKQPPIKTLPSACTATQVTTPLIPSRLTLLLVKLLSSVPSAFSRAMWLTPLLPFTVLKAPPMRIFPSACRAMQTMLSLVLASKAVSSVPSALIRAMLFLATPSTSENFPAMRNLPSACTTPAYTGPGRERALIRWIALY